MLSMILKVELVTFSNLFSELYCDVNVNIYYLDIIKAIYYNIMKKIERNL